MPLVSVDDHIAALENVGLRLADAAARVSLDTAVPTCPGWKVRDLIQHVGGVHRWAATFVAGSRIDPYTEEEEAAFFKAPSDSELTQWFRDGHAALVRTLREADPDVQCWSFLPAPTPLTFWARRQAHETAVHCFDSETSAGVAPPVDGHVSADLAVDGIDELLCGFLARPRGALIANPPTSLTVKPTDSPHAWTICIEPDRRVVVRTAQESDCVVSGRASDLYLFLWNRSSRDSVHVHGNARVLDLWTAKAHVRWA